MPELEATVMTLAHDPQTGEVKEFGNTANIPDDWLRGKPEGDSGVTLDSLAESDSLRRVLRLSFWGLLAYGVWRGVA